MDQFKYHLIIPFIIIHSIGLAQYLNGPTSVSLNSTHTYTFDDGELHPALNNWDVTRGTVLSQSISGTTYTAEIKWTSSGNGSINFLEVVGRDLWPVETMSVSISSGSPLPPPPPPAPPTPVVSSANTCQSAVISAPGTPSSDVAWYWIDSPDGFFTGDLNPVSAENDKTVSTTGTYYLASQRISTGLWNYEPTSIYVTIHPSTVGGSMASNSTAICGTNNVTFSLSGFVGTVLWWKIRHKNGSGNWSGWSFITDTDDITSVSPSLSTWSQGVRTYEVQAKIQSGDCSSTTRSKQVTVDPQSVGGTLSITPTSDGSSVGNNHEAFGIDNGQVNLTAQIGTILKWQKKTTGNWTDISESESSLSYVNLTEPIIYRAVVRSGNCQEAYSNEAFINILNEPTVTFNGAQSIRPGQSTTLSTDIGHSNYHWFKDGVSHENGGSNELVIYEPGQYHVIITSYGGATYTTGVAVIGNQLNVDGNAMIVTEYTVASVDDDIFSKLSSDVRISANKFDGLGRLSQTVLVGNSPVHTDLVVPTEYDISDNLTCRLFYTN